MRLLLLIATFALAGPTHAQFRIPNFDLNKAVESVKNVNKAVR